MAYAKEETEVAIHCAIADYLRLVVKPPNRWCTIEVSNQSSGKAAMLRQMALKRRGVTTGWPDIQLLWCFGVSPPAFHIVFFEVKAKAGVLTEKQKALHKELLDEGHSVFVVRSVEQVKSALKAIRFI